MTTTTTAPVTPWSLRRRIAALAGVSLAAYAGLVAIAASAGLDGDIEFSAGMLMRPAVVVAVFAVAAAATFVTRPRASADRRP